MHLMTTVYTCSLSYLMIVHQYDSGISQDASPPGTQVTIRSVLLSAVGKFHGLSRVGIDSCTSEIDSFILEAWVQLSDHSEEYHHWMNAGDVVLVAVFSDSQINFSETARVDSYCETGRSLAQGFRLPYYRWRVGGLPSFD